ncbi:MAG: NAD(P)/FAD-dependent oxidoreductase [Fimbriimonadaceae bacterium]
MNTTTYDVAIVGGGPSGSTLGSLLKKYAPHLRVGIFERELFPREHIGESLLPTVGRILNEIGVWDEIERAGFPIKVGATYKWGTTDDLWDFNLLDTREIVADAPRPGKFEGWRARSTWQVDRARFDKILLDRSATLGCEVHQETAVSKVETEGDAVTAMHLSDGTSVSARRYIDASGNAGIIRRALKVEVEEPPSLRNIAIWDHWEDAAWAVTIGSGATRIQITSLGYGWLWFIPISPTRTSIGLVCPAEYYKKSGKRPEDLYADAVRADDRVARLIAKARQSGAVKATKDWSFLAKRMAGKNWFLVGEAAGFADPILSAGITMSMVGALECAYTILEMDRGKYDAAWLTDHFEKRQIQRVTQHICFANFWYSANAHFTDLMEYTAEIAREAGLTMDAKTAWQWLGTGGFVSLETAGAGLAGHSLEQITNIQGMMSGEESEWLITKSNVFLPQVEGGEVDKIPFYFEGQIHERKLLRRSGKSLPISGGFRVALEILQKDTTLAGVIRELQAITKKMGPFVALSALEAIETMLRDGWVEGSYDPTQPLLRQEDIPRTTNVDWNRDRADPKARLPSALEV